MFNSILKALNRKKVDTIMHYASLRGVPKSTLDNESMMTLMKYPEATVITIIDMYVNLLNKGFNEIDAIDAIESRRTSMTRGMPNYPRKIKDFIVYRIEMEHSAFGVLAEGKDLNFIKRVAKVYLNNKQHGLL